MIVSSLLAHAEPLSSRHLIPKVQIDNEAAIEIYGDSLDPLSDSIIFHDMERHKDLLSKLRHGNKVTFMFYNHKSHPNVNVKSIFKLSGSDKALDYITEKCSNSY